MEVLIRRKDVLRLILAAGNNHAVAIREEENKAAASTAKIGAYQYAIRVLITLEVIMRDIPAVDLVPTPPVVAEYITDPDPDDCDDEDSTRRAEEEVYLHE